MKIRPMHGDETLLLTDFVYEAIYQRENEKALPRTVIQDPSIWAYIHRFGEEKDDFCMVAEVDGCVVGAAWTRCIQAFGYLEPSIPELAMSIYPQYRRRGIGSTLLFEILAFLCWKGYAKVSLSVQKDNPAAKIYHQIGFRTVKSTDQENIMVCDLEWLRKHAKRACW